MISIKEYQQAQKTRARLSKQKDKLGEIHNKQVRVIIDKYYSLKRKIEDKERAEHKKENNQYEKDEAKLNAQLEENYNPIVKVENLFKMFEVIRTPQYANTEYKVYIFYDDQKRILTPIDELKKDQYAKIGVYIVENRKPKNKYSLIVRGRSIFYTLISRNYAYSTGTHTEGVNVEFNLKDLPTREGLIEWYGKSKDQIIKQFLDIHKQLEADYQEAKSLYELKEWKLLYLENKKVYYEKGVYRGDETKEYAELVKELKRVKNEVA